MNDRFFSKVTVSESGCHEWNAARFKTGYGAITVGSKRNGTKRTEYAHRMAWTIAKGPIPNGMFVCHKCDNPRCVNPDHLFLGTSQDNMQDMSSKGRWGNQYSENPPTHCKRGHEFNEINTRIGSHGERVCRACAALWARENRKKHG